MSCCLKARAGYLASTWQMSASPPTNRPSGTERSGWPGAWFSWNVSTWHCVQNAMIIDSISQVKNTKWVFLHITRGDLRADDRLLWRAKAAAPLFFSVLWSSSSSVHELDNQYANVSSLSRALQKEISDYVYTSYQYIPRSGGHTSFSKKNNILWTIKGVRYAYHSHIYTSIAALIFWIRRSKTVVLSSSNDLQWTRQR